MMAVIRIRGDTGVRPEIKTTLRLFGLDRKNHLTLKPQNESVLEMLKKAQDYVTFGPLDAETLAVMLEKRGRLAGDRHLDAAFLKKHRLDSFEALAKEILDGKKTLSELGIKKVFRLHAPKKGFERAGIKKRFSMGGALGNRGTQINGLIQKMV